MAIDAQRGKARWKPLVSFRRGTLYNAWLQRYPHDTLRFELDPDLSSQTSLTSRAGLYRTFRIQTGILIGNRSGLHSKWRRAASPIEENDRARFSRFVSWVALRLLIPCHSIFIKSALLRSAPSSHAPLRFVSAPLSANEPPARTRLLRKHPREEHRPDPIPAGLQSCHHCHLSPGRC